MSKRGGLGRGLSALIPGAPESGEASGLLEVPVNAVSPIRSSRGRASMTRRSARWPRRSVKWGSSSRSSSARPARGTS